jgi:hypothetical protein
VHRQSGSAGQQVRVGRRRAFQPERLEQAAGHRVREVALQRRTPRGQHSHPRVVCDLLGGAQQAGLADAERTSDHGNAAAPTCGCRQQAGERGQLGIAVQQRSGHAEIVHPRR